MSLAPRHFPMLGAALSVAGGLAWLIAAGPEPKTGLGPALLFGALMVFTATFGLPAAGGWASLMPMTAVAGFLVMDMRTAAWTVGAAAFISPWFQHWFAGALDLARAPGRFGPMARAVGNATAHTGALLAGGALYRWTGGEAPLTTTNVLHAPQLALLSLSYLAVNYLLAAAFIAPHGPQALRQYGQSLPRIGLFEGVPLIFSSLVAVIYTRLGPAELVRFSLLLVAATLVMRSLGLARQRLERRVQELDSLQTVGQALGASLNLAEVLEAAYSAVSRLMPASLFYIALWDSETEEVSFPLVREGGAPAHWPARRAGRGLTDYVLQTGRALLIRQDVAHEAERLGLDPQHAPASWLGAPLLSGGEALGVMAAHSDSPQRLFDQAHRELMQTIAAQAALAIRNARLYAQTDRSLARRVQELSSILHTAREGILLIDQDYRVLAANRALAGFLGMALGDLAGDVRTRRKHGRAPLLEQIGYSAEAFDEERHALLEGNPGSGRREVILPGPPERFAARTLAPVRGRDSSVSGWLLVFHDLTEERALAELRDEWAHMLIHDLRAPVAALKSTLDMVPVLFQAGRVENLDRLLAATRQGADRLLNLIQELLDINRLEIGKLPLRREAVEVEPLLREVAGRLEPLTEPGAIRLDLTVETGLPPLDADRELVARVVTNLLDNAIKFTPAGGRIRLWAERPRAGETAGVALGVSDEGPGIGAEDQAHLFKKYHQRPAQERRTGTGLGLAFCKLVVEAHGGCIGVESEPGRGATFRVSLPSPAERL